MNRAEYLRTLIQVVERWLLQSDITTRTAVMLVNKLEDSKAELAELEKTHAQSSE